MEDVKVLEWIENGSGSRSDSSHDDGPGYGRGYGSGYGSGDGSGSGGGYGYGSGYGYGEGSGIKSFNGEFVYLIDGIQTIISNIKGNLARGFILNSDLTLSPCYIYKDNGRFVYGETLREVKDALQREP